MVQSQGSIAQLSQIDFHLTDETESAEICKKYNFLKGLQLERLVLVFQLIGP